MRDFKSSQEAAFRRLVRHSIRSGDFTKGERDVIIALVNHWFHHRAKGPIHPGREKIAKKAGVSVRTVASTMSMLRAASVLNPVSNLKGGHGAATRYTINSHALFVLCGCDWVDDFVRGRGENCTVVGSEIARLSRAKIAHGIYTTSNTSFPKSGGAKDE